MIVEAFLTAKENILEHYPSAICVKTNAGFAIRDKNNVNLSWDAKDAFSETEAWQQAWDKRVYKKSQIQRGF